MEKDGIKRKEGEWLVEFVNEASDEQIFSLFQESLDKSVREDIKKLLIDKKYEQS